MTDFEDLNRHYTIDDYHNHQSELPVEERNTPGKLVSRYLSPHDDLEAQKLIANYVCSGCWGHLIGHLVDGGTLVLCASCGIETVGYVSKRYAERRRQESSFERMEAAQVLHKIIKSNSSGLTVADHIKALGF